MRVVAGKFGGRRLQAPSSAVTRPTSDRVRESLFSMLADVNGALIQVDLGREQHEKLQPLNGERLYVKPRKLRVFMDD